MLFFLKDNKKEFILWLNVPKVTAYVKSMRNSRAEKYLLLRSLVRTVAATRVSVQIRELKIGGRREICPPDPLTSGK